MDGTLYHFTELMFGLRPACRVFTKFMRPVVAHLRQLGARVHPYLDDFLFCHKDKEKLVELRNYTGTLLDRLGLSRNEEKGQWSPVRDITHLGYRIDSVSHQLHIPEEKRTIIGHLASGIIQYGKTHKGWVSKKKLATLTGKTMSLRLALRDARTTCHSLFQVMTSVPDWRADVKIFADQAWSDLTDLRSLGSEMAHLPMRALPASVEMTSDASDLGWGVTLGTLELQGCFQEPEVSEHINVKEFLAVLWGLQHFRDRLRGKVIKWHIDNQVVIAVLKKGASKAPRLMDLLRQVRAECNQHAIVVQPQYIRSALNVRADLLSRSIPHAEWALKDSVFLELTEKFGVRTVDRFATKANTKCERFNSLREEPGSEGEALLCSWKGVRNYINPPWALIPRILQKLTMERSDTVLVLPYWPQQAWWPTLLDLEPVLWILERGESQAAVIPLSEVTPEPARNEAWRLVICHVLDQVCP